ncbi:hypothetical protein JOQ06_008046, partial [Pogonophryne albipinna]
IPETSTQKQQPGAKNGRKQSTIPAAFSSSGPKYKADSLEQGTKEKVIAQWIGRTGLPARTVEDEDFILMMETFDKRLNIPKKNNLPSGSEEESQESDEEDSEVVEDRRYGAIERTPCVVHTLQLVVDLIQKDLSVKPLVHRIRVLVRLFRKSSVAIQRLLKLCGLTLVKDCPTRWSSTYLMISRPLQVKDSLVQVADGMGWDCLLPSEWQKLTALRDLFLPFAEHTQMLQSDTMSLSLVLPALLDLNAHLSEFPEVQGPRFPVTEDEGKHGPTLQLLS